MTYCVRCVALRPGRGRFAGTHRNLSPDWWWPTIRGELVPNHGFATWWVLSLLSFPSGAAVRRPLWPRLECRRGSPRVGRPAPAGACARCSWRGSALGGRPAAASSGPARLAGRRPVPATRLPSRGKAAGKGRARSAGKGRPARARGGKGERGSRPALLPESRMTLGRKVRWQILDVLANADTESRYSYACPKAAAG